MMIANAGRYEQDACHTKVFDLKFLKKEVKPSNVIGDLVPPAGYLRRRPAPS
jgi:hypothetical protein